MNKQFYLKRIGLILCLFSLSFISSDVLAKEKKRVDRSAWKHYVGKTGPSGWRVNVIQPDPHDHGPDGFNRHDWDGDGDADIATTEENGGWGVIWFENPMND